MVGPRSSGCRNCVTKRVKCDEKRPHCSRCLRNGKQCPGNLPPLRFLVPETVDPLTRKNAAGPPRSDKVDAADRDAEREEQMVGSRPRPRRTAAPTVPSSRVSALPMMAQILTSPSAWNEDVFCGLFLARYFSFGIWNADLQSNKQWIVDGLQNPTSHPLLNLSLRGLVTGFSGHFHRDPALQRSAFQMHCQALAKLAQSMDRTELADPGFDLLACVSVLLIHEFYCCTNHRGWIQHARGLKALVQMKGPSYFRQRRLGLC